MSSKITSTRPKLDRAVVVDAAIALGDSEGLEAITIRRLAERLSVSPMALYWHFADKEALLAAIADRLWEEAAAQLVVAFDSPSSTKQDDDDECAPIREALTALVTVLRAHPTLAGLVPSRVLSCAAGLAVTERALSFLVDQGVDLEEAALISRFILTSAVMLVENQPGVEYLDVALRSEEMQAKKIALAALPSNLYPNLVAAAGYFTDCDSTDDYFEHSIGLIIAGARQRASLR